MFWPDTAAKSRRDVPRVIRRFLATRPGILLACLALLGASHAAQFVIVHGTNLFMPPIEVVLRWDLNWTIANFLPTLDIITRSVSTLTVVLLALRSTGQPTASVGSLAIRPAILALATVPIVAGGIIFLSEFFNLLRLGIPPAPYAEMIQGPPVKEKILTSVAGQILGGVVAPLTEEILFRGLILRLLLRSWSPAPAVILSALLFAVSHFNLAQTPGTLGMGLVLGWIYVRTGSVSLCIVGHALHNTCSRFSLLIPLEVPNFNYWPRSSTTVFQPWWFDLTGVALFVAGLWMIHRFAPPATPFAPPSPAPAAPPLTLSSASPENFT